MYKKMLVLSLLSALAVASQQSKTKEVAKLPKQVIDFCCALAQALPKESTPTKKFHEIDPRAWENKNELIRDMRLDPQNEAMSAEQLIELDTYCLKEIETLNLEADMPILYRTDNVFIQTPHIALVSAVFRLSNQGRGNLVAQFIQAIGSKNAIFCVSSLIEKYLNPENTRKTDLRLRCITCRFVRELIKIVG